MIRWLAALRRDRSELVDLALERLTESGSSLADHEAQYLVKACINAFCVALSQGRRGEFDETMAAVAEREARAGNALRAEAVVIALQVLSERATALMLAEPDSHSTDPRQILDHGRTRFLSTYLRAKAEEDDRRALALESYAEAVEDVPSIIYSTDDEGRITDISHQAAEQLGYRKEDLLGRHHSILMRPEDAERFSYFIQERRTHERATRRARLLLRGADGNEREFEVSSTGVYDDSGQYIGSDGIARAVTDEVVQLTYQLDAEGRFQSISEAASAILGFTKDELLGQHFSELMDVRERDRVGRMFGERRADDRAANRIRVILSGRDGATREFEISAVGQYDNDGHFVGTMGLGSDLSTRTELERGVAEKRRKYRQIFDQAGFGLSVISADLVIRDVNAWHLRRRRRRLDGAPCHLALFGEPRQCPWCGLHEALQSDREVAREEVLSPLDGRRYSVWFSPLRDEQGRLLGVVESVLDTTALRTTREALQEAERQAMIRRFATGTRQLLAEPLTALALADGAAAAGAEAVGRLRLLCGDEAVLRPGPPACCLAETIRTVIEAAELGESDAELDLLPTCPPAAISPVAAAAVVQELVDNALSAGPTGTSLTVELAGSLDEGVTLRVADTGLGMAPAEARGATEPFTTSYPDRHGLGLARCAAIVAACGGRLRLTSSPAAGTTVAVWLPATEERPLDGRPPTGEPDEAVRVTVALPDGALAAAIEGCLSAHGHQVVGPGESPDVWLTEPGAEVDGKTLVILPPGAPADDVSVGLRPPFLPAELLAALAEAVS